MNINSDILIIGGGINGTAIAADAALRGYKVVLIEQKDFASGTSSTSTKLIHGGLRYLAQGRIGLVRKALKERTRLYRNAPLYVKPLALNLAAQDNFMKYAINKIGLWFYDRLDWSNPFPVSQTVNLNDHYGSLLKPKFHRALKFYDGWTDDVRLTLANAKQAYQHGAHIFNYSEIQSCQFTENEWAVTFKNSQEQINLTSKFLINATGPWINKVNASLHIPEAHPIRLIQGSHLILKNHLPNDEGLILPTNDNRLVFVLPYYQDFMLVGTTEIEVSEPGYNLQIQDIEKQYLLEVCNQYFQKTISESDILHSYAGIRPLVGSSKSQKPSEISREYTIHDDLAQRRTLQIYGGKITTHRQLAEECLNKITHFENKDLPCKTGQTLLPGNQFNDLTIHQFMKNISTSFPQLDQHALSRLISIYGSETKFILETYLTNNDNPTPITRNIYDFEIQFLKEHEWLNSFDDFIWRRTKLGLTLNDKEKMLLEQFF